MAKQSGGVLSLLAWFTGVVVSLAVSFGLINGTLMLPGWLGGGTPVGNWIVMAVGWVALVTTLISAVMAILGR